MDHKRLPPKGTEGLPKYADLSYDTSFKVAFGHKAVLMSFLNTFLIREGDPPITDLVYRDKELGPSHAENRKVLFDVYCTTQDHRHIIVEMQRTKQTHFLERALYYISFHIQNQTSWHEDAKVAKGVPWTFEMDPVVFVGITNFVLFPHITSPVHHLELVERASGTIASDKIGLLFIELPKFKATTLPECSTLSERWGFYLRYIHTLDMEPTEEPDPGLRVLLNQALMANFSFEDLEAYIAEHNQTWVRNAEREAAIEDGKMLGREEGREEGRKEGREEGREENQTRTVLNMHNKGFTLEQIVAATELTKEAVVRILEENAA